MKDSQILKLNDFYSMYKNRDYSFETIYNGEIFLSFPKTFNDPFDCMFLIDKKEFELEYLKRLYGADLFDSEFCKRVSNIKNNSAFKEIEYLQLMNKHNPDAFPKNYAPLANVNISKLKADCSDLFQKYFSELQAVRNKYGVACFTLNKPENNMVMWAHYADNYDGFCCKFSFGNIKFNLVNKDGIDNYGYKLLKHFYKVVYTKRFKQLDAKTLLSIAPNELYNNKYVNDYIKKSLYKKHLQWSYENEYRLVLDKNDPSIKITYENDCGFRIKFNYLKELYISADKYSLRKELVVKEIAKKFNIKYLKLTANKGFVGLQEDTSEPNEHNIEIDIKNIICAK